jgi:hypothetical protein
MLLSHISQAVDLLTEKARLRQAQLDLARRTYVRTLVLDDAPPLDPQLLVDAVEALNLNGHDLASDAHAAQTRRECIALLPKLNLQIRDAAALANSERNPENEHIRDAAQSRLHTLHHELDLANIHLQQATLRAPRLFSQAAQKLLQLPIDTIPSPTDTAKPPLTPETPAPEPTDIESTDIESTNTQPTSQTPTTINEPYAW